MSKIVTYDPREDKGKVRDRSDWGRVDALTDEAIATAAAADPDAAPILTDADFARARWVHPGERRRKPRKAAAD